MNRTTRTAVVVGLAVLVAAVASLGAYQAIRRMPVREVEVRSIQQVVAAMDLPMGTMLTKDNVKLVSWPASSPVPNGFATVDAVVNRGVISAIVPNEPITEAKLAPLEAGAGLTPAIPDGMRAVSVRVNDVVGVAGFVVPGTRVDVMTTLAGGSGGDTLTRVVVSDVQVLTAGTVYDQQKSREGQPVPTSVVTLLLTPSDAERVTLAAAEGQIMLTLRNPLDRKPTETNGVRTSALFGPPPEPPKVVRAPSGRPTVVVAPPPMPAEPSIYSVETFRAAQRREVVVN
jgi:pilus assembly protein CpaB